MPAAKEGNETVLPLVAGSEVDVTAFRRENDVPAVGVDEGSLSESGTRSDHSDRPGRVGSAGQEQGDAARREAGNPHRGGDEVVDEVDSRRPQRGRHGSDVDRPGEPGQPGAPVPNRTRNAEYRGAGSGRLFPEEVLDHRLEARPVQAPIPADPEKAERSRADLRNRERGFRPAHVARENAHGGKVTGAGKATARPSRGKNLPGE